MSCVVETLGSGPHLTLLHGWGFGCGVWRSTLDALAGQFTVSLVELPGYPRNRSAQRHDTEGLLGELLEQIPEGSHLLGWSLGGMLALALAGRSPRKFGKRILVATNLRFVSSEDWAHAMQPATFDRFHDSVLADVQAALFRFGALSAQGSVCSKDQLRYFRQQLRESGAPEKDALERGLAMLNRFDLRASSGSSGSGALFLYGDNDALVPVGTAAEVQKRMPGARVEVFESSGHAPFLAHRQKFLSTVTEFLA